MHKTTIKKSAALFLHTIIVIFLSTNAAAENLRVSGSRTTTPSKTSELDGLKNNAYKGDVDAQYRLGEMYFYGQGVPKDATKAVEWFQKSADQGNAEAQTMLGMAYHSGNGVTKDITKAIELYLKAAAQGDTLAQYSLGYIYGHDDGVTKDLTKSAEWYLKAAVQGDITAQYALGLYYRLGLGVDQDYVRGFVWMSLAAAHGDEKAVRSRDRMESDLTQDQLVEGRRLLAKWEKGDSLQASKNNDTTDLTATANQSKWQGSNQVEEAQHQLERDQKATSKGITALHHAEKSYGNDHPNVATSLNNLAELYKTQGQYSLAETLYKRLLAIREKSLGLDHPDLAMTLNALGWLYNIQERYDKAEPLLKNALAIREKALGPDHPDVAESLVSLAGLYKYQGQFTLAETYLKRSLVILGKAHGPDHPDVASVLNNLGGLYHVQGEYAQAEPLLKRALVTREKSLGLDHPKVAATLNSLGLLYADQGQKVLAESLLKRALTIREKTLGPDHPDVAEGLNNLATLYRDMHKNAQAESLIKRALAIREKSLGSDHPVVAITLVNLGGMYVSQDNDAQAEPLYVRALAIFEKTQGSNHPNVAWVLNNLGVLYDLQGKFSQAEKQYKRSLEISENSLGPTHPKVAISLANLAYHYDEIGKYAEAMPLARRESSIYRQRIIAGGVDNLVSISDFKSHYGVFLHLKLLARNPMNEPAGNITDEAFQVVQLEQASGTADALTKMAARFVSGNDALSVLAKRKQDAIDLREKSEAQLVVAAGKSPQERKIENEQRLRGNITLAANEIGTIDVELSRRFPEYQLLTRPEPVSVKQVRSLLKNGEAMLVYSMGESSFLWVVKREGAVFMPLQIKAKEAAAKVTSVRSEMEFDDAGKARRVSVDKLYALYQSIFEPAQPHLAGVQHVMVVPAGSLQSLPFSMLIASPPPSIKTDADYREVDWLAKHYALSVLPSVGSIQAFRQFAKAGGSQEPFAGFGDPLIGGSGGTIRGKSTKLDVATVFRKLVLIKPAHAAQVPSTEIADVDAIRNASRLPETADELRAMSKALKSDQKSLWLQENATETKVKSLDLSKYRTIAFATHGVMAGEVKGVGESGLILTPPRQGTIEDDGYLSAGEIAKLKLNADWVILSACNTAAADGTPGAEGLSGLAKAFFYAGTRSLLVTHWPVASEATVPLTTGMLSEYKANPRQGKAESHRKAMLALMTTPNHPEYAHPIYWAPFVVVGEGGSGSTSKAETVVLGRQ